MREWGAGIAVRFSSLLAFKMEHQPADDEHKEDIARK